MGRAGRERPQLAAQRVLSEVVKGPLASQVTPGLALDVGLGEGEGQQGKDARDRNPTKELAGGWEQGVCQAMRASRRWGTWSPRLWGPGTVCGFRAADDQGEPSSQVGDGPRFRHWLVPGAHVSV